MADPKKPVAIEPWQVLESKYSYRDPWLAVRSDTVRVPNGTVLSPYHTIEFPEWVCAVALTPQQEILLIEEYRHGVKRLSFELPCGAPDHDGEDVLDAMKRELLGSCHSNRRRGRACFVMSDRSALRNLSAVWVARARVRDV